MPTKKAANGQQYEVSGKKFTWHPLDDDDQIGNLPDVVLPMRIKVGLLRGIAAAGQTTLDIEGVMAVLDRLIPDQSEAVDEMDVNDTMRMFNVYMVEYEKAAGATLGE